jgi:hypothetical protein
MTEMTVYENRRVLLIGRIKEEYAKEREEEGKVGHFFFTWSNYINICYDGCDLKII